MLTETKVEHFGENSQSKITLVYIAKTLRPFLGTRTKCTFNISCAPFLAPFLQIFGKNALRSETSGKISSQPVVSLDTYYCKNVSLIGGLGLSVYPLVIILFLSLVKISKTISSGKRVGIDICMKISLLISNVDD